MRTEINKIIFLLFFLTTSAYSLDLAKHEATCKEIGFTPKTEAFGECVLELSERGSQKNSISNNADENTCRSYGFKVNTQGYANCRMQIDLARQESLNQQKKYEQDKAAYDQQMSEIAKERERQKSMRQLELGLRMLGGQSPASALSSLGTNAPIAPTPPMPVNHTIVTPAGRMINCTTTGTLTNCF